MGPDNLENFESAFQKGLYENPNNFDSWLERRGINPEKLSFKSVENHFLMNPKNVNIYQQGFQKIAEIFGHYSRERDNIILISVVGVPGIGKSFFLKILQKIIKKSKNHLTSIYIENKIESKNFYPNFKGPKIYDLIILDSYGLGNIKFIIENRKTGVILSAWNTQQYEGIQKEFLNLHSYTNEIFLTPFDYEQSEQIMKKALLFISEKLEIGIKKEIYQLIYKKTGGIPREIIMFLFMCLEMQYNCKKDTWDEQLVNKVASKLKKIRKISFFEQILNGYEKNSEKLFLKFILTYDDPRGVHYKDLMNLLNVVHPKNIKYPVQGFISNGIVKGLGEVEGIYKFYSIAPYFKQYLKWILD